MDTRKVLGILVVKKYSAFSLLLQDYFFKSVSWQNLLKKSNLLHIEFYQAFQVLSGHLHQQLSKKHYDTLKPPVVKRY